MEKIETIETDRDLGNTEPNLKSEPKKKKTQGLQYVFWCFTYNNYEKETIGNLETIFKNECKWYVFQEETGKNGTPHLQGVIALKKKARMTELKNIDPAIHWECAKCVKSAIAYCSKNETRTGDVFIYNIELENYIDEALDYDEPYGWQLDVMNIIKEKPDKRTIHWFWSKSGGVGKSSLCRYLAIFHKAIICGGKINDIFHQISKTKIKKLIIIDVPRSSMGYVNYGGIEAIKNGHFFSGKYEGKQVIFNHPHVIVFANKPPAYSEMSEDRWNVVRIDAEWSSPQPPVPGGLSDTET